MGNVIYLNNNIFKNNLLFLIKEIVLSVSKNNNIFINKKYEEEISDFIFNHYNNLYFKDGIKSIYNDEFKEEIKKYVEFLFSEEFLTFDEIFLTEKEIELKRIINKLIKFKKNIFLKIYICIRKSYRSINIIYILLASLILMNIISFWILRENVYNAEEKLKINYKRESQKLSEGQINTIKNLVKLTKDKKQTHHMAIYSDLRKFLKKDFNISVKSYKQIPAKYFQDTIVFLKNY